MAAKIATTTKERIGRVGQRRQVVIPLEIFKNLGMREGDSVAVVQRGSSVVIKPVATHPKRLVDPDDVLTPAEAKLVSKAELEMKQGKFVTLAELHHELARKDYKDAAKQLEAIPPDRRKRVLADIDEFVEDPFRGLVKPLKGKKHKGRYRKVSGRYRIIFKPIHAIRTIEVLLVLLRDEQTYR